MRLLFYAGHVITRNPRNGRRSAFHLHSARSPPSFPAADFHVRATLYEGKRGGRGDDRNRISALFKRRAAPLGTECAPKRVGERDRGEPGDPNREPLTFHRDFSVFHAIIARP